METRPISSGESGGGYESRRQSEHGDARQLATALGWFSIGLGVAQVAVPGALARLIGIRDKAKTRSVMRAMGLREISHGAAILRQPSSSAAVWSRVAGDVLDLTLLGRAASNRRNDGRRIASAMAAVLGVAVLDVYDSVCLSRVSGSQKPAARSVGQIITRTAPTGTVHVKKTLTIRKPVEEVYSYWRDFKNLPTFMTHLQSVETTDEGRSHWKAQGPAGLKIEWDAEITADSPNERIEWRSLEHADIKNEGTVRFRPAPGDRGTEVFVDLKYDAPAGQLGAGIAMLFGEEPSQQVQDDLHAFKQVMETGEVVRSEGTLRGRYVQQPAQLPQAEAGS